MPVWLFLYSLSEPIEILVVETKVWEAKNINQPARSARSPSAPRRSAKITALIAHNMEEARQYVEAIIKPLLDHPDALSITSRNDEMGVFVEVNLHQEDMGLIIGKQGNTIKKIRDVVRLFALRHKAYIGLKINEPAGSTHANRMA